MIIANVPLRAVLWDFDGVLNDNAPGGRFLWSDGFEDTFGQPLDGFVEAVFGSLESVLTGREDILQRIGRWIDGTGAETTPEEVASHWFENDFHPNVRLVKTIERLSGLGLTQAKVAAAGGMQTRDLAKWLRGIDSRQPHVVEAGAGAMWGHAQNKDPCGICVPAGLLDEALSP